MLRMGKKNKKQLASICMIQYASVVGAHAAVEDFPKQTGGEWSNFDAVHWAANKEPDFINDYRMGESDSGSAPSTPASTSSKTKASVYLNLDGSLPTPLSSGQTTGNGLKKMPSFPSFASPKGSPFGKSVGVNSPSLEEITMIRLRNAEKKRLADEIQRQDEEIAAGEASNS